VQHPDRPGVPNSECKEPPEKKIAVVEEERKDCPAVRGANSAALREQVRLDNFHNVVVLATVFMALLAIGLALTGYFHKTWIPLCSAPESGAKGMVVCPIEQSQTFDIPPDGTPSVDIDLVVNQTATPYDLMVVELVGLTAAAVAAAAAIRRLRGSSEFHSLPAALAALKLPTGAITGFWACAHAWPIRARA
jgi:hypothetical protein